MKAGPSRRSRMPHRRGALGRACHLPIVYHELLLQIPLRCRPTYRRHLVLLSMTARRIRGHTSHSGSISERPHRRSHRARRESGEHVHCNAMRVVEGKTVIGVCGRRRRRRRRWGVEIIRSGCFNNVPVFGAQSQSLLNRIGVWKSSFGPHGRIDLR